MVLDVNPRYGRSLCGYFFAYLRHLKRHKAACATPIPPVWTWPKLAGYCVCRVQIVRGLQRDSDVARKRTSRPPAGFACSRTTSIWSTVRTADTSLVG